MQPWQHRFVNHIRDAEMMMVDCAFDEAFSHFKAALAEVPEPQADHYEATRAVIGIADCYYFLGKYELAQQPLRDLLLLPDGAANPYIRLRRGQVFHHLGDAKAAAMEWTCAYLNGGREVFCGETDCKEQIDAVILPLDPLLGIDETPWSRIVHFYGRATQVPSWIKQLASDTHEEAEQELRACLEHQDGVLQATPFAVWFIVRMLRANKVRDPVAVRRVLRVIQSAASFQLESVEAKQPLLTWRDLLAEQRLWPEFESEAQDEIEWGKWAPTQEEIDSWITLTDRYISEGLSESPE